jgi:hypothetical protein
MASSQIQFVAGIKYSTYVKETKIYSQLKKTAWKNIALSFWNSVSSISLV